MDIFIVPLIGFLLALWLIWRWQKIQYFSKLGIPGPQPSIVFGNILELFTKGPLKCHEDWVKKYGRTVGYYYGMQPVLLVTDPMILKNIFIRDFNKFINREAFNPLFKYDPNDKQGHSILVLEGQDWKDCRSVLTPTFTATKMKQMAGSMNSSIDDMVKIMREEAEMGNDLEIHNTFQRLTMDVISRTAFGVRLDVQTNPKSAIMHAVKILFRTAYRDPIIFVGLTFPLLRRLCSRVQIWTSQLFNRGVKPRDALVRGIKKVLQLRRANPKERKVDLLQLMMDATIKTDNRNVDVSKLEVGQAESEDKHDSEEKPSNKTRTMTEEEIVGSAFVVLLAGYETTSTALAFTTYLLAKHPNIQEKLFEEINELIQSGEKLEYTTINKLPYLDKVLCESMRIYPPVTLFTNRFAVENVQYGDLKIPKGTLIQAPVYSLHHDEEFWPDPDTFDPERFNTKPNSNGITYIPFGVGPRNCLGMRFAQVEAKLALAHTIFNFRIQLSDKDLFKLAVRIRTITPGNGVYVKLECRNVETRL